MNRPVQLFHEREVARTVELELVDEEVGVARVVEGALFVQLFVERARGVHVVALSSLIHPIIQHLS